MSTLDDGKSRNLRRYGRGVLGIDSELRATLSGIQFTRGVEERRFKYTVPRCHTRYVACEVITAGTRAQLVPGRCKTRVT